MTPACSLLDPPPVDQWWTQGDVLSTPLREYVDAYAASHGAEFNLEKAKIEMKAELNAMWEKPSQDPDGG